ncbi:bifunctional phosphopantothenoylcysteine decarboxylase/phosphopantothenate--cysteine ligase CoaBC [Porphyromonas sp.]|uniref:bifunctional phosphopantothenoylcysteine decarboxylase/phosphopantothenate--cysteine ligase CoaBC n=1 Tax=Porphyromonas sp. TaxID=1924944 RepID=UPI0026DDB3B4|nr:bifunctional phosphopantothenoylcysteine decarboxylase/phosphopantothenate--cysteine ligase CoaBC [Porphyromonas sp.]MDO4771301.1 bifunctional phosphopantothenoylcysteine decarboxylase/phosphopantothenate--cysteine ligase CoaBC [Porphyromonas sp.]
MSLKDKNIVLGITGSIAAYKSAVLARLLIKAGARVQVVMTPAAKEFITPLTLSTLTGKDVISEFFNERSGSWNSHVDLGLWADAMIVAPATAATLGKMAHGIADNILITLYLSCRATVFVAPAMDLDMFAHPSTHESLDILLRRGNLVIEPGEGELASHLIGKGRMAEPEEIVAVLEEYFKEDRPLAGKKVLITSGPTYEKIDPVRFVGNYSTGKMGLALAEACAAAGATVVFVTGPVHQLPQGQNIDIIKVESAIEMRDACLKHADSYDLGILCAAVADYRPATMADSKIKREETGAMTLHLEPNPDIAATLGGIKKEHQHLVGFALETDATPEQVLAKMHRKGLDMIVLNSLADKGAGFGTETNKITIFSADGSFEEYPLKSKKEVAKDILSSIIAHDLLA